MFRKTALVDSLVAAGDAFQHPVSGEESWNAQQSKEFHSIKHILRQKKGNNTFCFFADVKWHIIVLAPHKNSVL